MVGKRLWVFSVVAFLGFAFLGFAQKGGKPSGGTTPVTADFRAPGLGLDGDRIDGDGLGTYVDGQDKVSATIESGAHLADFRLILSMTHHPGRRELFLDFGDCATPGQCNPPFSQGRVSGNTMMRTLAANLPGMNVGESAAVRLRVEFDEVDPADGQSKHWFLRFDPLDFDTNCQGSTVLISRLDTSSWVVYSNGSDVACLLVQPGIMVKEVRGRFRHPFQVTVRTK